MRVKNFFSVITVAFVIASFGFGIVCGVKEKNEAYASSVDPKYDVTNIFVQISKKMIPSVVNIFTTSTIRSGWNTQQGGGLGGPDDLWRRFFEEFLGEPYGGGNMRGRSIPKAQSLGSGFIIESTNTGGLILTNNHVIDEADEIKVKFTEAVDEKETDAEVVGRDPELDVALIRVKTRRKLQAAILADSDRLEVGEWIAALGNPFGHGHSVSHGIISAKERALPGGFGKYLQVDAPINPGNSGGPLVNLNGDVVGINNAIDSRGPGIGFAIPINQVKYILTQLKEKGKVERGYIGVSVDELRPELARSLKLDDSLRAPIITNVMPGHPADKAGIKVYDVILKVAENYVHTAAELVSAITAVDIGSKVKIEVLRSGKPMIFLVDVNKRPAFHAEKNKAGRSDKKKSSRDLQNQSGMIVEDIDEEVAQELGLPTNYKGVVVAQVMPGGMAEDVGLERGDVILEIDQKKVKTVDAFNAVLRQKKKGLLRVRKVDGTFVFVTLKMVAESKQDE